MLNINKILIGFTMALAITGLSACGDKKEASTNPTYQEFSMYKTGDGAILLMHDGDLHSNLLESVDEIKYLPASGDSLSATVLYKGEIRDETYEHLTVEEADISSQLLNKGLEVELADINGSGTISIRAIKKDGSASRFEVQID